MHVDKRVLVWVGAGWSLTHACEHAKRKGATQAGGARNLLIVNPLSAINPKDSNSL